MSRLGHREIFDTLNALSRHQVLTPAQSRALEQAMAKIRAEEGQRSGGRRWEPREIDEVKAVMRFDARPGRVPRAEEIGIDLLASSLGRTRESVIQCMKRLRAVARGTARSPEYQLSMELQAE